MARPLLLWLYRAVVFPERILRYLLERPFSSLVRTARFGLREAMVFSSSVDQWLRYSAIAEAIKNAGRQNLTLLDLGAGGSGIGFFLDRARYRVCVLDRDWSRLHSAPLRQSLWVVVADACALPFASDSFDVVVSSDNLEHIAPDRRPDYYRECRRVARRKVLLHVPTTDETGTFCGDYYDRKFQDLYRRTTGIEEANIAEHLRNGLPTIRDLRAAFPGANLTGWQGGEAWFQYMVMERIPYIRLGAGIFYLLFHRGRELRPPFYSCILSWEKPGQPAVAGRGAEA